MQVARSALGGRRDACAFEIVEQIGPVAQWLEQGTHNPLVGGSTPSGPTFAALRQMLPFLA